MVALVDRYAGIVDVQSVEPAGHPCGDVSEVSLIVIDFSYHSDDGCDEFAFDGCSFDVHQRHCVFADRELPKVSGNSGIFLI
jgi:hypothetical protein